MFAGRWHTESQAELGNEEHVLQPHVSISAQAAKCRSCVKIVAESWEGPQATLQSWWVEEAVEKKNGQIDG